MHSDKWILILLGVIIGLLIGPCGPRMSYIMHHPGET
jgi:hypothetical protein